MLHDSENNATLTNKKIDAQIEQFDRRTAQEQKKLEFDKQKHNNDMALKRQQIARQKSR